MLKRLRARLAARLVKWLMPELLWQMSNASRRFQNMPLKQTLERDRLLFPRLTAPESAQGSPGEKGWQRERLRHLLDTPASPPRGPQSPRQTGTA